MTTAKEIVERIERDGVDFVDFRFTDPRGKWQHLSQNRDTITEEFLTEGVLFDGSSIAGWKDINESDMLLVPQLDTCVEDPFFENLLVIVCDVHEPASRARYNRDPRGVARRGAPRSISLRPASGTSPISVPSPSSSSSTACASR